MRHQRLLELSGVTEESALFQNNEWLRTVTENHRTALQTIDQALNAMQAPSVRSGRSNRSASSARSQLLKSELE